MVNIFLLFGKMVNLTTDIDPLAWGLYNIAKFV